MTAGELKFALKVESVLNSLPDPEYRQLVVEVLMLTALINPEKPLPQVINVDDIIKTANFLFLIDQVQYTFTCIIIIITISKLLTIIHVQVTMHVLY